MSLAKRLANQKTKWTAADCMDAAAELSRLDQVEQEFETLKKVAAVPDVDALAQFIRMTDGAHQMGAGALAERICEWLRSAPTAAQGPECETCDGAGGWERANSSTSYSWKDCPDCTAQTAVVDSGAENDPKSPGTRANTRVPGGGQPQPVGVVEAAVRGAGGFHVRLSKGADMPRVGAELYLQQVVSVVQHPIATDVAAELERSDWKPEKALRWYAAGRHYDTVPNGDGTSSARILDTGAVASNALKSMSLEYANSKGDVALLEPREKSAAQQQPDAAHRGSQ